MPMFDEGKNADLVMQEVSHRAVELGLRAEFPTEFPTDWNKVRVRLYWPHPRTLMYRGDLREASAWLYGYSRAISVLGGSVGDANT